METSYRTSLGRRSKVDPPGRVMMHTRRRSPGPLAFADRGPIRARSRVREIEAVRDHFRPQEWTSLNYTLNPCPLLNSSYPEAPSPHDGRFHSRPFSPPTIARAGLVRAFSPAVWASQRARCRRGPAREPAFPCGRSLELRQRDRAVRREPGRAGPASSGVIRPGRYSCP